VTRRELQRLVLALLCGAAAWRADGSETPAALLGLPVESIAFTCDGPADPAEIKALVAFQVGWPLTEVDTGATIRNLFATLDYSDVVIEAEPAPGGGVAVIVRLWRSFRIGGIELDGSSSLSREELRRAIPFSERDPFDRRLLAEGAAAMERRLAADGYIHARVDPEVTFDQATFSATVVYRILAGERARVALPVFDGDIAPFTVETLVRQARLKVGSPYRESLARTDAERLRKFLIGEGHFKAGVELIAAEPTDDGDIRPVYRIRVGPRFVIEATGIGERRVRREFLRLLEVQTFDADLLEEWSETTREGLQRSGRFRARVSATTEGADPTVVRVTVEPGQKYSVESVSIAGNASVPDATLRPLLATRRRGLPLLEPGRLLDRDLSADASALLGYYQTNGWIGARVDKPAVTEGSRPDRLLVKFTIEEGPRAFVESRQVEGAEHLTPVEIEGLLSIRAGEPFNPSAVRRDVAAIRTRYENTGWREASVQERWTLSDDKTKVEVLYRIDEGVRSFFGKTILRGNAVTDPDRILRQIAWKEGEPFSEAKIADTQRNLARTGAFRSIEVRPQPADPASEEHNVKVNLTEARRVSLLYGVGYQYANGASNPNDPFVTLGATYRNLFGRMQSASIEVQYAPVSQRGYVVANFLEPYLFNTEIPLTVAAFASRQPIQDIDINRVGLFLESVRMFGHLRAGLRYSYQYIAPENPEDLSTIVLEKYPLSARPIKQSAIGPSFFYDRRDDVLDPHKGYYLSIAGNYAFPFLNADANFGKISGQAAYFWTVPGGVLASSFRAGGIYPHSVTTRGDTVPIAEKFFAGGSSTARGFDTDLAGIPDFTVDYNTQATLHQGSGVGSCAALYPSLPEYDCSPGPRIIGGNGFMAWGLEYRFPIAGNLGLSVFYDLAQVWSNPGDINFKIEGTGPRQGLRQSIGLGLHYMTPIGPLRLEVGRPVELREIDFLVTSTVQPDGKPCDPSPCRLAVGSVKEKGRIFLSIGYPF